MAIPQTTKNHYWGSSSKTVAEIELSKEKRPHYYSGHANIILLHDNGRPQVEESVKTYLDTWKVLHHPKGAVSSDFHLF